MSNQTALVKRSTLILTTFAFTLLALFGLARGVAGSAANTQAPSVGPAAFLVKDLTATGENPASTPIEFVEMNSIYYFLATTAATGKELWRTNGTVAGTYMVKDIAPGPDGSTPYGLTVVNNILYFAARDVPSNSELWRSDGTAAGTYLVKEIYPGTASSGLNRFFTYNNLLFFLVLQQKDFDT